jgi:hypothetical protein
MRFSRILAVVFGLLAPLAETVRRWDTWREDPPALFDDYLLGAVLLAGAWLGGRDLNRGPRFLAAAWGFFCGLAFAGCLGQFYRLQHGEPDPAPIPSLWVAVIKGVGLALGIAALTATLWATPQPGVASLGSGGRAEATDGHT